MVCLVCGLLPIAILVLMIPLPETPSWLILKGRGEKYVVKNYVL